MPRHLIKSQQLDKSLISSIFSCADYIEKNPHMPFNMSGRIMATLFYEPSTRTRLSFESAMLRMGGQIITTENAKEFSSAAKGENIEDTIRVMQNYADVIVMRHYEEGAAERASKVSNVPIVNAGDGPGQHPTQALIDLYTIQKEIGRLDDITIAMVGDLLNGRTVRSLSYLLSMYSNITIYMVSPPIVKMKEDILTHLKSKGVKTIITDNLDEALRNSDVIYQTRVQNERFAEMSSVEKQIGNQLNITTDTLSKMKSDAIIMHPLPRLKEISPEVDSDPRAAYFRQAQRAVPIRGAILKYLLVTDSTIKMSTFLN